jgi:DNA topoisomerase IA
MSFTCLFVCTLQVPVSRAVFHEITREAIARAFAATRQIDYALVDAQETRRIIDRCTPALHTLEVYMFYIH